MDEVEKHRKNIDFSEGGEYLITNQEIELIPIERFAEFSQQMYAQADQYDMSLSVEMEDNGILIKWKKNAT